MRIDLACRRRVDLLICVPGSPPWWAAGGLMESGSTKLEVLNPEPGTLNPSLFLVQKPLDILVSPVQDQNIRLP